MAAQKIQYRRRAAVYTEGNKSKSRRKRYACKIVWIAKYSPSGGGYDAGGKAGYGRLLSCLPYAAIPDMDVPAIYLMDGATGLNGSHVVLDYLTDPCRADDPRTAYATPEMIALNRVDLKQAAETYKDDALMSGLVQQAEKYRPGGRQHISFPSGINIGAAFDLSVPRKSVKRSDRNCEMQV